MRKLCCVMLVFGALLTGQDLLNNEAIIKMVKAGVPEEVIVEMIRTRPGHYSLSPDNVIDLKKQGVPAAALTAMVKKDSPAAAVPAATPPASAPPPSTAAPSVAPAPIPAAAPSGSWLVEDGQDQMSGDVRVYAARNYPSVDGAGAIQVEAVCQPKVFLHVGMSYQSNRHAVLKATSIEKKSSAGPGSGASTTHENCVFMRLRIGDGLVKDVTSESCDTQNFASILFPGATADIMKTERTQKVKAAEMEEVSAVYGAGISKLFGQLLDSTQGALGPLADRMETSLGVGNMADVFAARSVKIELPLNDGSFPAFEIAPQEPSFQLFAAKCGQSISDPRRGYLGATFRTVNHGLVVNEVAAGAPAARSGLETGDVITALDGKPAEDANRFSIAVLSHPPGATVNLDVIRDGKPVKIAATLDRRPEVTASAPPRPAAASTGSAGLGAANPMNTTSRIGAPAAPPLFTGTVEGFAAEFPGFVERAGMKPHEFDKEIALIVNTVRTCSQITPQMAASVDIGIMVEDVWKLGEQYRPCQTGVSSRDIGSWNKDTDRGLLAVFRPIGPRPKWQNGLGFTVSVTLFGSNSSQITPVVYARITGAR